MGGKRSPILVKRGRMSDSEKHALTDFYSVWGAEGAQMDDLREWVKYEATYGFSAIVKLISRGMLDVFVESRANFVDMTPQGEAVARMILGMVKRKRR